MYISTAVIYTPLIAGDAGSSLTLQSVEAPLALSVSVTLLHVMLLDEYDVWSPLGRYPVQV